MGALWKNISNSFMQAIDGIVDNRLQDTVGNLEKGRRAEGAMKPMASSCRTKRKEREFAGSENDLPSKRVSSREDFTHGKRRRVLTTSSAEEGELKPKAEVMEERLLREMLVDGKIQRTEALTALSINMQVGRPVRPSAVILTCFFIFRNPTDQVSKGLKTETHSVWVIYLQL